jgi:TetR/AcrR family transcriptional repressor of nem operon
MRLLDAAVDVIRAQG